MQAVQWCSGVSIAIIIVTIIIVTNILILFHTLLHFAHITIHYNTTGYTFYHIDGMPTRPALENWMQRLFDMEEFNDKKAYYNVDQVINGWKNARG